MKLASREEGRRLDLYAMLRYRLPLGLVSYQKPRAKLVNIILPDRTFFAWTMAAEKALWQDRDCITSVQF